MKKVTLFTLCLLGGAATFSQVSNGDFSAATKAPRTFDQIKLASDWSNGNGGTADFYHKNAKKCSKMGVPENRVGNQAAFKGDGYAGIIAYYNDKSFDIGASIKNVEVMEGTGYGKYSEYLSSKLSATLVAGKTYTITYYVSLAENSGYAVSGFGALFGTEKTIQSSNAFIEKQPQVSTSVVASSKSEWTKISSHFTAKGGEQFVTIGVFNKPGNITEVSGGKGINGRRAYYFIDGISVTEGGGNPNDNDNDGLTNEEEKKIGTDPNNPDTDGDTMNDKADECPLTPGTVAYDGCVLSKEERIAIQDASDHIYFNTGSASLKEESFVDLDKLAAILVKHPEVRASIEGHTDSQGDDQLNLKLSKERAQSVKDYLIKDGVKPDHLSSEGFGEKRPVADNATAEGRKKNRRVMVRTSFFKAN